MELVVFQVTSEWLEDRTLVVSVTGELDLYTVPDLEQALRSADGAESVVIELSRCTFIESTALGILLAAKRRLDGARIEFSIVAPSPEVRRPFELTGVDGEFTFQRSLASALNSGTG